MKRVYVAGPMTPRGRRSDTTNAAIEYLLNIRDMIHASVVLMGRGYAPYCPGLDKDYFLTKESIQAISEEQIKAISMAFLEACDMIVLLPGWEDSPGCQAEYQRAVELGMPIYACGLEGVPNDPR